MNSQTLINPYEQSKMFDLELFSTQKEKQQWVVRRRVGKQWATLWKFDKKKSEAIWLPPDYEGVRKPKTWKTYGGAARNAELAGSYSNCRAYAEALKPVGTQFVKPLGKAA